MIWMLALLSLLNLEQKKKHKEVILVLGSIVMFLGLYLLVALLTVNYVWIAGHKEITGLSRLILHFFPLSVLFIILSNYPGTSRPQKIKSP